MPPPPPSPNANDRERGSLLTRILGEGESPVWWSLPLFVVGGCRVRLHVVAVVFVLAVLAYAIWNGLGPIYVATGLVALGGVVVLHEAARGHALVRWCGLRPTDVTLWPLGAVWRFEAGNESAGRSAGRAEGLGAAVGLGMLAAVGAAAAGAVVLVMGPDAQLVFDPLRPGVALGEISGSSTPATIGLVLLWQVYAAAVYVLAFNLLPMLPLDEGVLVGAVFDRDGSRALAPRVGLLVAMGLLGVGLLTGLLLVAGIGVCGGAYCWHVWQQRRFAVDPAGVDRWRGLLDAPADETGSGEPPISAADREDVERILAKISASGIGSLSRGERRTLREATARLRDR
ncbi:MAG: hypothetical protein Q9O74_01745 [Planctomycetota bacterium]|nr:hypothetical protein [Planctomycetota bacterium]